MNVPRNKKNTTIVLTQETVHFGGMILDYRLVACPSQTERFRICSYIRKRDRRVGARMRH